MAGELLSYGIQKLWDLLSQECERFQGVEDQVTGLKRDLNLLSSFLKDADAKKHTTAVVRNVVEEIQEIVYDAEDMIETYLLKEELGKTSGIKKSIRRFACIIPDRRRHVLDIGSIRTRISNAVQDMQRFGVQQAITDSQCMQQQGDRRREMRQAFPKDYESDFVGLDENVSKLVQDLVEKDDIQIVSITGMGGLGKTTLARQVFNHEDVKHRFDGLAWVCVSQEFTRISVWQTILQNLSSKEKKDEILTMKEAELQDELFQLLETSKSLIVLDDIWKEDDWDRIKPIFPPKKGWKVLITSRNESVAVGADTKYLNFKPECLTSEDTWTLFQRIAFQKKDISECKVDEEMKKLGEQMVKHCGGLPLAIKVLGGLLAAKYTLHDWKRLSENIGSHILGRTSGNSSFIYHVLSMSFEELPSYLKHCFLYLAHFPDDHKINVETLSYFWVAEGIFKPSYQDGETIRDVGDSCIDELVRRNMVISERDSKRLRFKTCHLHDMMREICLFKAKEQNFLEIAGSYSTTSNFQSPCRSRRLVCQHPTTLHVEKDINTQKLRSLVVVLDRYGEWWELLGTSYKRLELLRVLDLFQAKFRGRKLPSSIGKLLHLRYLSLKDAEVSHIPFSLGNLKLLIYLNMGVAVGLKFVPNVLMGMQELRYLELPCTIVNDSNLELSNLVNLETLRNFSTKNSSLEDLHGMVRLRTLKISLFSEISIKALYESITGLRNLENLEIEGYGGPDRKLEEGIVLDFDNLRELSLSMKMSRLPKAQQFPSQLMILSLSGCGLKEDPMPILEKLLHLRKVSLWWDSFYGKRMVCSRGGFPQLRKLLLTDQPELEEWIIEKGSMPLLHTLTIFRCRKLKQLPDGIKYITSLKYLTMGKTWEKSLSEGGEDHYKVKHIPFVKFV